MRACPSARADPVQEDALLCCSRQPARRGGRSRPLGESAVQAAEGTMPSACVSPRPHRGGGGPNAQARPWTPLPHEETRSLPTGAGQLRPRSTDTRLACAEGQLGLSPPGRPSSSGSGPRPLPARGHLRLSWAPHRGLAWQREPRPTSRGLRRAGRPAQLCCSGRGLALEACRRPHTLRIASLCAFKRFRSLSFSFRVRKSFFFRASKSKRA